MSAATKTSKKKTCPAAHHIRGNGLKKQKTIYNTETEAMQVIQAMNHGSIISAEPLEVYQCRFFDHYHIGRAQKVNQLNEEWELLQQSLKGLRKAKGIRKAAV